MPIHMVILQLHLDVLKCMAYAMRYGLDFWNFQSWLWQYLNRGNAHQEQQDQEEQTVDDEHDLAAEEDNRLYTHTARIPFHSMNSLLYIA